MVRRQQGPKGLETESLQKAAVGSPSGRGRSRSGPPSPNGREDTPLPSKNKSGVNKPESKTSPPGRGEPPPCTGTVQVEAGVRPVGPEIEIGAPGGGAIAPSPRTGMLHLPLPLDRLHYEISLGRQGSTARRR